MMSIMSTTCLFYLCFLCAFGSGRSFVRVEFHDLSDDLLLNLTSDKTFDLEDVIHLSGKFTSLPVGPFCSCHEPLEVFNLSSKNCLSLLNCSYSCHKRNECIAFNYNEKNNVCSLFANSTCLFRKSHCQHFLQKNLTRKLFASADDEIESIYVDGVQILGLPNSADWYYHDTFPIPYYARVIAVKAHNLQGSGGITLLSEDAFINGDVMSWKCSEKFELGWFYPTFNDSLWQTPTITRENFMFTGSKTVWLNLSPDIIYCRYRTNLFKDKK